MTQKYIEFTKNINEYYVDKDDQDEANFENNRIIKQNSVKFLKPMFKNIFKIESNNLSTGKFPKKQNWGIIKYIDYEDMKITSSTFFTFEDEKNPD